MKQNLLFNHASALGMRFIMVLTMLLCVGVGQAWGATDSFTCSTPSGASSPITGTSDGGYFTVSHSKAEASNWYDSNAAHWRVYQGATVTITPKSGVKITKIEMTVTSDSYPASRLGCPWEGESDQPVVLTATAQCRPKTITVTYEEASADPYTVTFHTTATAETPLTEASAGDGVTPPTMEEECGDWTFQGWSESFSDSETSTTKLDLVTLDEGIYYPAADVDLYPVYTKTEGGGGSTEETLSQTLQYDTWSYSGSTTNKTSYRLFHSNSYVESAEFDLSTLSKVVVYGGTFGGDSYNKLTIAGVVGGTTTTWKSVTVSGSSQTGVNTYTGGTSLSGTGKLRVTSNSGSSSGNGSGVRISKIMIYTLQATSTTYYYSYPQCSTETLGCLPHEKAQSDKAVLDILI